MKTKLTSILVVFIISTISCTAQKTITVEAVNNDISNNLDLQAVASTFGESKDLEDFEKRLNDYDSQISNLDLNNDGEVDYLRVIENMENNVHVVVIQAVLDRNVFQDVATIVVEKRNNRRTMVQVIGDPYLYGDNYVIEPVYVYTPSIFSFFWGYNYHSWNSPYYYGYYPRYYHNRHPFEMNFYLSHINSHINHDHRYFYANHYNNEYAERLHRSMSRNDYGTRYPDRNFSKRNVSISNKREFDNSRTNNTIYDRRRTDNNQSDRRLENNQGSRGDNYGNGSRGYENRSSNSSINQRTSTPTTNDRSSRVNSNQDDIYQKRSTIDNSVNRNNSWQNGNSRTERNANTQSYSQPTTPQTNRSSDVNRNNQNNTYQRPERPVNTETRQQPTITRENNQSKPAAPVVNQPSRQPQTQTKAPERSSERSSERKAGSSENTERR